MDEHTNIFTMKTIYNYLTALLIAGAGVLLCMMNSREAVAHSIVMILGIMFIFCGTITLLSLLRSVRRDRQGAVMRGIEWVTSIGGIGLAVAMLLSPEWFIGVLVFVFSALLLIGALSQIVALAWGYRGVKFPGWLYIVPVLMIIASVAMFFSDTLRYDTSTMLLVTGICFIMFGANYLVQLVIGQARTPRLSPTVESPTRKSAAAESSVSETVKVRGGDDTEGSGDK